MVRTFDLKGARHFADPRRVAHPILAESFTAFLAREVEPGTVLHEGTTPFESFRAQALREVDRYWLLALSNHRRSQDLLRPAAASWAWVTAYYGSYFAAHAILGLFGVTCRPRHYLVEVQHNSPGAQELASLSFAPDPKGQSGGSHERFWTSFYEYAQLFRAGLPPALKSAVDPVNGDPGWQIEQRSKQNYDSFEALQTAYQVNASFQATRFPDSLSPDFARQLNLTASMIDLLLWLCHDFKLDTDCFDPLGARGSRQQTAERFVRRFEGPFSKNRPLFNAPRTGHAPTLYRP